MKKNTKKGFTLVELSFALVFIAILLVVIAWLTIHITTTYEKGLTMKAVNATSKELIDDFSRAIATSPARSVESLCSRYSAYPDERSACISDNARKFFYQQRYGTVKINGEKEQVPVNGVFCTGRYSYIWNTAYALNTDKETGYPPYANGITSYAATFHYTGGETKDFRILKVPDFTREVCIRNLDTKHYLYNGYYDYYLNSSDTSSFEELLDRDTDGTNTHLALYDFVIYPPAIHNTTSSAFYSGTFILASLRGGININATGEFCSEPAETLSTDFAYCSINKYNFSMKAAGESTQRDRLL